jgi:IS5 family transposase
MIKVDKLLERASTFLRLTGVPADKFRQLIIALEPLWGEKVTAKYKRPGRNCVLSLEQQLFALLCYYRFYISMEVLGAFSGVDAATICRCIARLEPLLAEITDIKKTREMRAEDFETLIIDATESPIERPTKGQREYYSGKKKQHTIKTEIRIDGRSCIRHVSKTVPGSCHDFRLLKEGEPLPSDKVILADSGYQGIAALSDRTCIPFKESKIRPLSEEEKKFNRQLARVRVRVEHVFRQMKIFKILANQYRNKGKKYNLKFKIIAGIVNMKNGFQTAIA